MPLMKQKVTAFRKEVARNVGTQFHLRGDVRENRFKNNKPAFIENIDIPAYLIQPKHKISSKEWIERIHATVHAAIFRSIRTGLQIRVNTPEKENPKNLPIIQVFRTKFGAKSTDTSFNQEFSQYREMYEDGNVHGRRKSTFRESILNKNRPFADTKLFDVSLTKKEYIDIINKIKKDLINAKSPFSFEELNRSLFFDKRDPKLKEKVELFYRITKLRKGIQFTNETTPSSIGQYLFYLELSRVMTNKLVRKTIEYVEKQKKKSTA
jgi:hypothetical protein